MMVNTKTFIALNVMTQVGLLTYISHEYFVIYNLYSIYILSVIQLCEADGVVVVVKVVD